jgi:hypothetical protein
MAGCNAQRGGFGCAEWGGKNKEKEDAIRPVVLRHRRADTGK